MAQMVEHILGKDEVTGSIPVSSSSFFSAINPLNKGFMAFFWCLKTLSKTSEPIFEFGCLCIGGDEED